MVAMAGAVLFFIWHAAVYLPGELKNIGYSKTDFVVFYAAGASITGSQPIEPVDLYGKPIKAIIHGLSTHKGGTTYLYLPQAAVLFAPFGLLSFADAAFVMLALNICFLLGAYYLTIWGLLRDSVFRLRYSVLLVVLTFTDTWVGLLLRGQVNGAVWFLLVLGTVMLVRQKQIVAGALISIATVFKIFPVIFVPYFLIKKQFAAAVSFAAAQCIILLATLPFFGVDGITYFLRHELPDLLHGHIGSLAQSTSLFGSFRMSVKLGWFDFISINRKFVVSVGEDVHRVLVILALIALVWLWWRLRAQRTPTQYLFEYSVIILFVLLFSKSIHDDFHFWMLPFLLYLVRAPLQKKYSAHHLLAAAILIVTQWWSLLPFDEDGTFLIFKAPTAGLLLALFLCVLGTWPYLRARLFYDAADSGDTAASSSRSI